MSFLYFALFFGIYPMQHASDSAARMYTLTNKNHCTATLSNFGARWVSFKIPDRTGHMKEMLLGANSLEGYRRSPIYGATVGRYANRIAGGKFRLLDSVYHLSINNDTNTIHGGAQGFHTKTWKAKKLSEHSVQFTYMSADGEEGFPGNLLVSVTYTLTDHNEVSVVYNASADKPTVVNLTNHAFFNLNGEGSGTIENHMLKMNAGHFLPIVPGGLPDGTIASVKNSPFDFRSAKKIGKDIRQSVPQLENGKGYDHHFIADGKGLRVVALARGDQSGIAMEVRTTEPGLQLYTGNNMNGSNNLRTGTDRFRTAFCLETQHFPDSPNHPDFPSTLLLPGKDFKSETVYRFYLGKRM